MRLAPSTAKAINSSASASSFPLYRRMEKNLQLLEFKCVPFTEELLYGRFRKQVSK